MEIITTTIQAIQNGYLLIYKDKNNETVTKYFEKKETLFAFLNGLVY